MVKGTTTNAYPPSISILGEDMAGNSTPEPAMVMGMFVVGAARLIALWFIRRKNRMECISISSICEMAFQKTCDRLSRIPDEFQVQCFHCVSRLVVIWISKKCSIGNHNSGDIVLPKRRVIAQANLRKVNARPWHD